MLNFAYQEHHKSYYFDTRNLNLQFPRLSSPQSCDVCIIGAGFQGLSTALELAERGKKVIVLEGARVGFGASGRSGGQESTVLKKALMNILNRLALRKQNNFGKCHLKRLISLTSV